MVGFQGEEAFRGRGVAYCATCDGEFFTDKGGLYGEGGFCLLPRRRAFSTHRTPAM